MLQDVIHPPEQLPIEEISSPINAQMFEFGDLELFPETLQNSDVSSCSNCCFEDNSSYTTNLSSSFPSDIGNFYNNNSNSYTSTATTTTINNLPIIFDSQDQSDKDISASINFLSQPTFPIHPLLTNHEDQFDISSLQTQIPLNVVNGFTPYSPDQVISLTGPPLPSVFEDDCLPPLPSYANLDPSSPSCSFIDPTVGQFLPGNFNSAVFASNGSGIYAGGILISPELQPQELEFQGDNGGVFGSDLMQQGYSSSNIQVLDNDNQHLVNGGSSTLTSEIANSLEESTFKVGRLSVEERKEKIHRYMKKRNERNFSKKIKYACRKTLADSRPRVRGRFAKNDDFNEATRLSGSNHEDEDDEELGVKEEDSMVDSSDIFAHISGVNSFKCNYPIQSWI